MQACVRCPQLQEGQRSGSTASNIEDREMHSAYLLLGLESLVCLLFDRTTRHVSYVVNAG
jgi:hypothetical protein